MRYTFFLILPLVAGCAEFAQIEPAPVPEEDIAVTDAPPPPPSARTVEQFDTTTEDQRIAAASPDTGGQRLGSTVASLGDAASPGFWIETALVDTAGTGRLVNPATGKEVEVELRPIESGSSRVSLAALRVLDAPLTDLVTLDVFRN